MKYAVILDGQVVNVVLWDGEAEWSPGEEYSVIDCGEEVGIGWTWNTDDGFIEPVVENPA